MRTRTLLSALLVFALAVAWAPGASAQRINLPPVTRATWDNGVRVVLMEYHRAPTLSVTAIFPGGSSVEPAGKPGVAGLTADLLRKGTTSRTAPQIAEQIDFLGGALGAGAGDDRLSVSLNVLSKDTETGLEIFRDIIRNATLPSEELERERQLGIAGLESLKEDPGAVASRVASEVTFTGHPYGAAATVTSLRAITREDLESYYRRFVTPDHMILVAVGDFKAADMMAKLKSRFGDWPRAGGETPQVPPVKPLSRRIVLVDKPDATQTYVHFVRPAFERSSKDYFAAQVANSILGGGFTSRLTDAIRVNRSLTYSIGSGFSPQLHGGAFDVGTFTKIETTRALIDATTQELGKTASGGFTAAELKKVKGYMAGLFALRVQTPEALAAQLADIAFYNLPADYLQTYLSRVQSISLADANRIAKTYFAPTTLSIVMVAPAAKVEKQLQGIGTVEKRSVDAVGK